MKLFGFSRKSGGPRCAAVIVAAGSSQRMGGVDKIMADLGGRPVIYHTLLAFQNSEVIDEIVLVTRQDLVERLAELAAQWEFSKVSQVVPGGKTRIESVENGLRAVDKQTDYVAVQDGARPLVTDEIIRETVERAYRSHAAAPGVPVVDTIKTVDDTQRVTGTPDRATLRAVQTPQVFDRDLLQAAWAKARQENREYTDDCAAMEALGVPVYLTQGSPENLKITTPLDLKLAALILQGRETT
jgi:2-C-methyl-D-erythritol 4-phosphate cytidylyltransferase